MPPTRQETVIFGLARSGKQLLRRGLGLVSSGKVLSAEPEVETYTEKFGIRYGYAVFVLEGISPGTINPDTLLPNPATSFTMTDTYGVVPANLDEHMAALASKTFHVEFRNSEKSPGEGWFQLGGQKNTWFAWFEEGPDVPKLSDAEFVRRDSYSYSWPYVVNLADPNSQIGTTTVTFSAGTGSFTQSYSDATTNESSTVSYIGYTIDQYGRPIMQFSTT